MAATALGLATFLNPLQHPPIIASEMQQFAMFNLELFTHDAIAMSNHLAKTEGSTTYLQCDSKSFGILAWFHDLLN